MRYIDVADEYVNQILEANKLSNHSLTEAKKPEMKKKDEEEDKKMEKQEESTELHQCPLCESELDEALTVERIQEHIEQILETINEAEEFEGEELSEAEDDDEEEKEEEDEDEEEDSNS
jgi:hypothetical protein|tara:strand:- start:45 stop:401 length:357 start_codon:yes stop_codon:yes gene_type:complete